MTFTCDNYLNWFGFNLDCWWILLISSIVWGVLAWMAWRNSSKIYPLYFKLILNTLAVLFVALVGLRPAYFKSSDDQLAILLTENTAPNTLDSLRKVFPNNSVLDYSNNSTFYLPNLSLSYPHLNRLIILGDGIAPEQFSYLDSLEVFPILNALPEGITSMQYPQSIVAGDSLLGWIEYNSLNEAQKTLAISYLTHQQHLPPIKAAGSFNLAFKLGFPTAGHHFITIKITTANKEEEKTAVFPIEVLPREKLNIAILNNSPSFEINYLKNWLADQGHSIVVRTTISSERFKWEFLNRVAPKSKSLNTILKDPLDVILVTEELLNQFNYKHRYLLKQKISEGTGIGLFTQTPNFDQINSFLGSQPTTLSSFDFSLPKLPESGPSLKGQYRLFSSGKAAWLKADNTFEWLLEGEPKLYSSVWEEIMSTLSQKQQSLPIWSFPQRPLHFSDQPVKMDLFYPNTVPQPALITPSKDTISLAFTQHPYFPQQWSTSFIPNEEGSYQLIPQGLLWVNDTDSWKSLRRATLIKANEKYFSQRKQLSWKSKGTKVSTPVPLGWFYLGFLLTVALLWLEDKW